MTEHHDHRDDCPFKFATLDVCDCVEKNMLDRIEDLEAKLAECEARLGKAVEALERIAGVKGPYSRPFPESYEGYGAFAIVTSRETLEEIKGESHD